MCIEEWFSTPGRRELKRPVWVYLFKRQNIFVNQFKLHSQALKSSVLVRNVFVCCSLQNSLSTDQQLLTKFTFSSYCLLAFTSLNNVRTFCAYFIFWDEWLVYNVVIVCWDLLIVFLTESKFYSPTLTHALSGNNQQRIEDPLEMRWSNLHFLKD